MEQTSAELMEFQKRYRVWPKAFCLVTGPPRSGTSAVLSWLSEHPEVAAFRESRMMIAIHRFMEEVRRFRSLTSRKRELFDTARCLTYAYYAGRKDLTGRNLVVDKEPLEPIAFPDKQYVRFLKNVKRLIPDAKLLFLVRSPVPTVWSMRQREWGVSLRKRPLRTFSLDEYIENWCTCVDIMLQYAHGHHTYICQFERLVEDPQNESRRLLEFLHLSQHEAFQPQATQTIHFSETERDFILSKTSSQVEALNVHGRVS